MRVASTDSRPFCAISTPRAAGGIAVIRVCGSGAVALAAKVFRPAGTARVEDLAGNTCVYGKIFDNNALLDDGILTVFRSPHSYTGEDTAELSCHGGVYVSQRVLDALLKAGGRPAEPGEYTKTAFLNGKLSLAQAESVLDVISAGSEGALRNAAALREGALFQKISAAAAILTDKLSALAAWADYPEEDLPEVSDDALNADLQQVLTQLKTMADRYDYGRILRDGVNTVICGRPNVGKSTLFNALAGCQRSIVTSIAGTTRDVIEEQVRLGNLLLRLSDTAGLRETEDQIEQIGVEQARSRMEQAELILAVFDSTEPLTQEDLALLSALKGHPRTLLILNKSDQNPILCDKQLAEFALPVCTLSAKDGQGLETLETALEQLVLDAPPSEDAALANARQKSCLDSAISALADACFALSSGEPLDGVTVLLETALDALLSLTGERVTDAVVDAVFRNFCVGK